jgi:hypothetical protein
MSTEKLTHRCGTSWMEVKRRARRQVVRRSFPGTTGAGPETGYADERGGPEADFRRAEEEMGQGEGREIIQ